MRLALEGAGPGIGRRASAWTAGIELADTEAHSLLAFRARDGRTRNVDGVLGSGGTSYAGERNAVGVFAEVTVPISDTVDVRAAARSDEYDDVGGLRSWRLGAEYRPIEIVTLRGSWSNDELLNLLPKGVIAFPASGGGITENLIDRARQMGIPVMKAA